MIVNPPYSANRAQAPETNNADSVPRQNRKRGFFRRNSWALLLGALALLTLGATARGQSSLMLAWDPSTGTTIRGYHLYWGTTSQNCTNALSLGNITQTTLSNLTVGATYYFAVAGVDTNGFEGTLSSQLAFVIPPPTLTNTPPPTTPGTNPSSLTLAWNASTGTTISGYHLYWGTTSQNYTSKLNLGNVTQATVSNLTVGVTYYFAVAAVDINGFEGKLSSEVVYTVPGTVPPPPVATSITIAATSGTITSPFVAANGTISQATETAVANGGRAVYTFTVNQTGYYVVSAMVSATNDNANSFFVNIDAEPTDPMSIWDIPVAPGFTNRTVSWRGAGTYQANEFTPMVFGLSQGTHQLIIRGREANTVLGTITIAPAPALPAPWQTADIGTVSVMGSASIAGGVYGVQGSGKISGVADSFRYLYQGLTGDGEVRAQISSIQNSTTNGCSGVMIRETLAAGSRYTLLALGPDNAYRWQNRVTTSGSTTSTRPGSGTPPQAWARLVRTGNVINAYTSPDGSTWTSAGSVTNVMASNIYIGLAATSGATNQLNTTGFGNVTVVP